MKNDFKKLGLKKLTIARISINNLKQIQGGSSDPTDPNHNANPEISREQGCTYSIFQ